MAKMTLESVREHWKNDFKELREDIEKLSNSLNEFEEKVNNAKDLDELGYLSDCTDLENGLKHIRIF